VLFGKTDGNALQDWCIEKHRPLIWADKGDSGALLDAVVGVKVLEVAKAPFITDAVLSAFNMSWGLAKGSNVTFSSVYKSSPAAIKFILPSYPTRTACESYENQGFSVIGTNANVPADCVYFAPFPAFRDFKWEVGII
jgi:hypothetical protein